MLTYYETKDQLLDAYNKTKNFPNLFYIYYTIETELLGRFPETKPHVFFHETPSGDGLWIILRENFTYRFDNIIFGANPKAIFKYHSKIDHIFDEIDSRFPNFLTRKDGPLVKSPENVFVQYKEWLLNKYPTMELDEHQGNFFFMREQERDKLMSVNVSLPEGYIFGDFEEKDLDRIMLTRPVGARNDYDMLRAYFTRLPTSVIKKDGQLVAYILLDPCGYLKAHFVFEDHRGKGLGRAVEQDLAKKVIKLGIIPNKCVATSNTIVLDAANRSAYWTRWNDSHGKPVVFYYVKQKLV